VTTHKRPFLLHEIKIEVTHDCPLACVHCSSDSMLTTKRNIDKDRCLQIIDEAAEMGVKKITFSGGEPVVCKWLDEAVKRSCNLQMEVTIYTSGNVENINLIFNKLKQCGLNRVIFSLYSDNEVEHERITRKKGSYQTTINAIKSAQKQNISTEIHFVALATNYRRIPAIAKLSRDIGANRISILRFVPQGRGLLVSNYILSKEQNLELRKIIIELRDQGYDIRTGSPYNFLMINKNPICLSAINRLIVLPDLRIYPCDAFKQIKAEEICDSIEYSELTNNSLIDCWDKSKYFNEIRKYVANDIQGPCENCAYLAGCSSGCLAQKFVIYGTLANNCDPSCLFIEK